jgi:ribosomal protein S18 acetylase RimI-like enzyme
MDTQRIITEFDAEMRAQPEVWGKQHVEEEGGVVRVVGDHSWITYSRLDATSAPAAIRRQTEYFGRLGKRVEWKVFGHDRPSNLGDLLLEEGYSPDPTETLEVLDLAELPSFGQGTSEVEVQTVTDPAGLSTAVAVSEEAFGPDRGWSLQDFTELLGDPRVRLFLAYVAGKPVAAGRLEMPDGRAFASLWGGGTSPSYRGRGVYRALVQARALTARNRGYRYLTVDALPTSRPILERVGFVPLTTMTGWVFDPSRGA